MAIVRSTGAFFGTSESSGTSVSNNATTVGSEIDLLGDNTSVGDIWIYLYVVSTVTAGFVELKINNIRVTGQVYSKVSFEIAIPPTNGTQKIPLGKRPCSRFMNVEVKNNATGQPATVSVLYELEKMS